jgi:hypothetical protein
MNTQRILALIGLSLVLLSKTRDGVTEIWVGLAGYGCMFASGMLPLLARWGLIPPGMVNAKKRSGKPVQQVAARDDHGRGDRG